jgi:hypothetical protein
MLALSASPDASQPAPPLPAIARLGITPWTLDDYEASYAAKLQNARLAGKPNPEKIAVRETENHRLREYPSELSVKKRKRLYRLELAWIEKERARRQFGAAGVDARRVK